MMDNLQKFGDQVIHYSHYICVIVTSHSNYNTNSQIFLMYNYPNHTLPLEKTSLSSCNFLKFYRFIFFQLHICITLFLFIQGK